MRTQIEGKDTKTMITLRGEKPIGEDRTHKKPPRGSTAFFLFILGTKALWQEVVLLLNKASFKNIYTWK